MLLNLPWEESAKDPDKYIQMLEEKKDAAERELRQLNRKLKQVRQLKKHKDIWEEWERNGVPDLPGSRANSSAQDNDSAEASDGPNGVTGGPTRKKRVIDLMRQNPSYIWKVADVEQALGDANNKSLRVAMDELVRSGQLTKHKGSNYQINPDHPESL
ncbi:hypothetical protein ACFW3D_07745 [Streptomyces sp. NPDC058864]